MMEYPDIDRYASLDSPMHRFDPRAKIIAFLFLICSLVLLPSLKLAFIGLLISLLFLIASKLPFRFVFMHFKLISLFIIPFLVIMPLTVKGDEIFRFYGIKITYEGLEYGILVAVRAFSAAILIFPMIATTKFETTIKALDSLKVPNLLVQMLTFTYRYIFVFVNEFQRVWRAMQSRGFELRRKNMHAIRSIGNAMGMILVRSYERSERVYNAMRSAGYSGNQKILVKFEMHARDYILAISIITIAISLQIISFVSGGMGYV